MKLGTFAQHLDDACRQRNISLASAAEKAISFGITSVCVGSDTVDDPKKERERIENVGLKISDVYGSVDFITGIDCEATVLRHLERTAAMGASTLLVTTEAYRDPKDENKRLEDNNAVAEGLSLCVKHAKDCGIKIVVEDYDVNNGPFAYMKDLKYILDRAPGAFFAFDSGNFILAGEDEVEALKLLKPHFAHAHFKDRGTAKYMPEENIVQTFKSLSGKEYYPCPVGAGIIRYDEIAKIMREVDYDSMILIEHFDAPDQLMYLERSAEFIKGLLGL